MSKLIIRPGTVDDVDPVQSLANDAKTLPFLGGFTMRDQLIGLYQKNDEFPHHVVAELDGEVIGFSDSKNKNLAYIEYDLVAVKTDLRRQRIATAMYTYHLMRGALMGKKFMRDQTIHFNTIMQDGYLPSLGFTHIAGLRSKVRNFSTLNWWMLPIDVPTMDKFMTQAKSGPHDVEFIGLQDLKVFSKLEEYYLNSEQLIENKDDMLSLKTNRGHARELLNG